MSDKFNKLAEHIADKVGSPISILIHTILIAATLCLMWFVEVNRVLLILTTWLSIEAIYLSLFIQLVVTNRTK